MAYAHIKHDKSEARALRCILIGYLVGVKGYKVWNLEHHGPKCFNTRDATFDETKMGYSMLQGGKTDTECLIPNSQVEVEDCRSTKGGKETSQGEIDSKFES